MTLLQELWRATEGSRRLDRLIGEAVGAPKRNQYPGITPPAHLHYTTSLDAALTLVPDGGGYLIKHPIGQQPEACVWYRKTEYTNGHVVVNAPTPALALCIAALKAIEREKAKDSVA